jgi:hypothetical protein
MIAEVTNRLHGRLSRPWTVERLAASFAASVDSDYRADLVYLLAASRTPAGLRVAGEALSSPELSVRVSAAEGIYLYWLPVKVMGGTETTILAAEAFWATQQAEPRDH